jgi:Asp-tRNA(Asn)/Glu-tRNA(Gln) amidotransferase A subunit family amidase
MWWKWVRKRLLRWVARTPAVLGFVLVCLVSVAACSGVGAAGSPMSEAPEDSDASEPAAPSSDVDALRLGDLGGSGRFHLEEATIADILRALQRREVTCGSLIRAYYRRIKAYSGHCIKYDKNGDGVGPDYDFYMPSGKGVYLGVVEAVPNAGKVNAIQSVNLRPAHYTELGFSPPDDPGPRSETDLVDDDPDLPDAIETADALDRDYRATGVLHPLQCVPMVIKDQMETKDLRTTDGSLTEFKSDRPPNDGTLIAKLRAAGAIILAKANMDEYASGNHRSSYGGQICNPYATDRNGGSSSTGSAAAVSTNLAVCGIGEESGGSIHEPSAKQHLVGMTSTRGLVSRFGTWSAELLRERFGPLCRTVDDVARVVDVIRGYDPKDSITVSQVGYASPAPLYTYSHAPTLRGKRLGIVREFMPGITVNDAESIRVFNEEVIPILRNAGADLVESINPRDVANGWQVDDPSIPNFSIQDVVAEMVPTLEPAFANPATVATPSLTDGLLPNTLRQVFDPAVPALFSPGTDIIKQSVAMFYGDTPFPDVINLRKLGLGPAGTLNEVIYGLDKMLRRRGDPRVTDVTDLSVDFDDLNHDGITDQHLSFSFIADDATGTVTQKTRPGVTPSSGVPATPSGIILDTQGEAGHLFRMEAIREIVERILADNHLDALIYPFETIPPPILSGTKDSIAWLVYDGRQNRGWNSFGDASGLPDIGVPAGFTQVVYDRTTRGPSTSEQLALNPPSIRREVKLPLNIEFLGKPWSEPQLLELASAFEKARGPRTPPPGFGPIPGEP